MIKMICNARVFLLLWVIAFSIFGMVTSSTLAESPIQMASRIDVAWDIAETQQPIIPRDEIKMLNLSVNYTIDMGKYFAEGFYANYLNATNARGDHAIARIQLDIVESSPLCFAAVKSNSVYVNFSKNVKTSAILYVTINEDAPAFGSGYIQIKASIGLIQFTPIEGYSSIFNLTFTPAYFPYIGVNLPKDNAKEVNPMEQAVFPIELENLGNARTKVFFEVVNLSSDWVAVVTDEITLNETQGSTGIAYLTVRVPKDIGYRDEKKIIRVAITPARAEDISDKGDEIYVTFIIKNKGLSTPGFGMEILIATSLLTTILIIIRRQKKGT